MTSEREGGLLSPAELPVNPKVLAALLRALADRRLPTAEIEAIVRCDPALTLQVLLAGCERATSEETFALQTCVDAVGQEVLEALAFRHAMHGLGRRPAVGPHSPLHETWRRSLICAHIAAGLARRAGQPEQAAYVAGLLHAVGKLAMLERQPDYAATLASARSDQELLRLERAAGLRPHDAIGAGLVAGCTRPMFLVDALRLQRERVELLVDAPFLVRAVSVASRLFEEGPGQQVCSDATLLLGVHERAVVRAMEEGQEAAVRNAGGVDLARSLPGGWPEPGEPLALPAVVNATNGREWGEVTHALGESGLRAAVRQALATAHGENETLRRTRHLSGMLLGFHRLLVFLANAEDRVLRAVPSEGDPVQLRELVVPLATSRSLLATAARERRPVQAFGSALDESGAAADRVIARLLHAEGLFCVPLSSGTGVTGVVAFALDAPWDDHDASQRSILGVVTLAAAEAIAHAAARRREEERARGELTAQFRAMGKRVVHEAGNPLSIVKNYLQVLSRKVGESGQFREELTILNEELDRIARIVHRMGEPFGTESEGAGALDLNALVREVVTLCNETLFAGRGIEVHQQLDPALPPLRSEPGAVKQVVLNLMTNAAEAMPHGGRLMLLTSDSVNLDGESFVLLQVTDTGTGVPPEVMQRLFQPGTSTKGAGHEGIGLAVSESIVHRLGGRILCRSSTGRGTIFGVLLPRRTGSDPNAPDSSH